MGEPAATATTGGARTGRRGTSSGCRRRTAADPGAAGLVVRAATEELQRRHRNRRRGTPGMVTDAELWVDTQTWERARALLEEASALLHDGALPPRTEGSELVNLSLFAFVMESQ